MADILPTPFSCEQNAQNLINAGNPRDAGKAKAGRTGIRRSPSDRGWLPVVPSIRTRRTPCNETNVRYLGNSDVIRGRV
jgi:hypothetical protein